MIKSPSVTIIILNWNGIADTLTLLKELEAVNYPNFSVLVVDNASIDDSLGQLARFIEKQHRSAAKPNAKPNYDLSLLPLSKNFGFAEGNNKGVAQANRAKPDYFLLLNNDTLVAPDFLSHLVNAAEADGQIAAVAPTIYWASPRGQKTDRVWYAGGWLNWFAGGAHHKTTLPADRESTIASSTISVPFLTGCCLLIKRTAVAKIDLLFDPAFFAYNEDLDLSLRLTKSGWLLGYVPAAFIWHKLAGSSGGPKSVNFWYYNVRNNFLILARYGSWYHWPIFILYFLFYKPVMVSLLGAIFRPRADKWPRLAAIFQATGDAIGGKTGQRS